MRDSGLRERGEQAYREDGQEFDLLVSKLRRPVRWSQTVFRAPLVERLEREDSRPIVSVVAPPGYGKTTLLSQWAETGGAAFAWVSVDEKDNDPKVLLTYVAEALDAVQPIGAGVFDALASPTSSVPGSVVPRLGSAFWSMTVPVVLVLDDVHLLHNAGCRAALSVLADHVPVGSRLVLAGQTDPPLRIARLRAQGKIWEIGPADLSLDREEAGSLLREAGVTLGQDEVAALHERTEGWPAGLYLAALFLREGGSLGTAISFGGDDLLVSQYMESEFLSRISQRHRLFLTRTAVLERMCGSLCEAMLELPDAAAELADLAGSNLLLVPLDRRGVWYRYHHLFRDMLLAELERREPGIVPVLRRRAAAWYLDNGLPEEALEYFIAAGDVQEVARLVPELWLQTYRQGRVSTLQRWFGWLEERGGIEGHPMVAVWASALAGTTGRPAEAERWADVVDRWQYGDAARPDDPYVEGWAAVMRALLSRHGVEQVRADADEAAAKFTAAGIAVPPAVGVLRGIACALCGDPDGADASFEDALRTGQGIGAPNILADALSEQALLAMARGDWSRAEALISRARAIMRETGVEELLVCAVYARVALHRGDLAAAQQQVILAQRLRPLETYAFPHLAVQARIELVRVYLALADMAGARTLMREIDEILERRPGLGTLVDEARELRTRISADRGSANPGASSLTTAELRVLPLLATHLSFPEIGAEMFLSPHTVKSQAMSIYRKLGVSSRNQAVTRSRELGLLEG